jgi:16S rRNA (cytosine967-C5)-methyltransferase
MRNKGSLRAYDIEANKLKELQRRARRANAKIIQTEILKQGATLPENENWADVVLVDAPCSGLGTLKRNPELKWRLTEATLKSLQQTQTALLQQAAPWIKPNGVLVYATCSILPSENQQIVNTFLNSHEGFQLEEEQSYYAHQSSFDGFYMARMKKTS